MKLIVMVTTLIFAGQLHAACANFTGTWKGTCTIEGQTASQPDELKLQQTGCESLTWGEQKLEFGKSASTNQTIEEVEESTTSLVQWNAAQSAFTLTYTTEAKKKGTTTKIYSGKGTVEFKLVSGKLATTGVVAETFFEPGAQPQSETTKRSCSYTRQ